MNFSTVGYHHTIPESMLYSQSLSLGTSRHVLGKIIAVLVLGKIIAVLVIGKIIAVLVIGKIIAVLVLG